MNPSNADTPSPLDPRADRSNPSGDPGGEGRPLGGDGFSVERARASDASTIDAYLAGVSEASVFQTPVWHAILRSAYGHRCDYWTARSGDKIVGAFPVTRMRLPILGTKMVATPYQFHSGYPLATDEAVQSALVERAVDAARAEGAKYLEIRHNRPAPLLEHLGFVGVDSQLVVTTVPLDGMDVHTIRRDHRLRMRRAVKKGVTTTVGVTLEDLKLFRRIYLRQSRALGAPQAGWRFFADLHELGRSHYRLFLAWYQNRCIGGLLCLDDGSTTFARYAAYGSAEAMKLDIGRVVYWRAISDAAERGRRWFNCGISWTGDMGLIAWKEGWRGETLPVHVYVRPLRSRPPAPGGYFEGYGLAKAVWRRLPLSVVGPLGHAVTRWIG